MNCGPPACQAGGDLIFTIGYECVTHSVTQKFYPNVWDLIGGHCENRESPEQALLRELKEELDIIPTEFQEIGILDEPNVEVYGESQYHVYLITDWNGVPGNQQPQEHSEIQWFSIEDALSITLSNLLV